MGGINLKKNALYNYLLLYLPLTALAVYTLFNPLVNCIDSVYGFFAYKGTINTHQFNVLAEVNDQNINETKTTFISWWSPGQWLFPAFFHYFMGIRLGMASIIVTIIFSILGFWGYCQLFRHFKFSAKIIFLSLSGILMSCTFYSSYLIYQGGEILEFGIFPWFLLYLLKLEKLDIKNFFVFTFLFFLCFVAKTTLILYCFLAMSGKFFFEAFSNYKTTGKIAVSSKNVTLLFSTITSSIILYFFYLSKGPRPTVINTFNFDLKGILTALSSSLSSIFSIQQWVIRIESFANRTQSIAGMSFVISIFIYLSLISLFFYVGLKIYYQKNIDRTYKHLLISLYIGLTTFFLMAYLYGTNIDKSSRHFKLLGYLFLPGLLSILHQWLRPGIIKLFFFILLSLSIFDFLYLKQKWISHRYISDNFFYRKRDILNQAFDKIDVDTYKKIMALDSQADKTAIFFVEGDEDISVDITHQTIFINSFSSPLHKPYHGNGPSIFVCISRSTLLNTPNFLASKFPDYTNFRIIDSTKEYLFFSTVDVPQKIIK